MKRASASVVALLGVACAPDFDDRPYLLEQPQLIAVIAEPAEVRPRENVTFTPIVAGPGAQDVVLGFRFCTQQPPAADPRPVAEACFTAPGVPIQSVGNRASGDVPADACARFGPDPADNKFRPNDPDATGGFYQPVVIEGLHEPAIARVRIHCPLPDLAADLARDFEARYSLNTNPQLDTLEVAGTANAAPVLRAGVATQLRATWTTASTETYALAANGATIDEQRESMRVSWFTTSGKFAASATGPESASASESQNTFTTDADGDPTDFWIVLQDSRGGVDAKRLRLESRR